MPKQEKQTLKVEISPISIITVILIVLGFYFIFLIRFVIIAFFLAFVISAALQPLVKWLCKKKLPRWTAVTITYIGIILLTLIIISAISVPLIRELDRLIDNLPDLVKGFIVGINNVASRFGLKEGLIDKSLVEKNIENVTENLTDNLGKIITTGANSVSQVLRFLTGVFGGIINVFSILTISFYLTLDHDNFVEQLRKRIPNKELAKKVTQLITDIETKLGKWLTGQFILSVNAGFLTWLLLTVLGMPYALPLGLLAALLDSIPTIGATSAAIPSVIIALLNGNPLQIIGVPVGYILIQQLENNILVPRVMSSAIGIPPITVIFAILIGAELYGIPGIVLAVPVAAVIHLTSDFLSKNYSKN